MIALITRFAARVLAVTVLALTLVPAAAQADEGMWTFDNFPSAAVGKAYGFAPSKAWLAHVQRASLRDAGGCSASFISPHGLVMLNHHCTVSCVGQLSTAQQNFVQSGFTAKTEADEQACPAYELDQLATITNVTAQMRAAIGNKTGDAANLAERAEEATLQQSCGSDPGVRCDVVSLYKGGVYDLYRYNRYRDVRLVFTPEYAVAQFGGDPDNFNYPRYDFDVSLLRVYQNGKPLENPDYFKWSPNGTKAGDLVFVSGNPGGTDRELTMAQYAYLRDHVYPVGIPALMELRGQLEQFITRGPEQAREANELLFFIENDYKADVGRNGALLDPQFIAQKAKAERSFRAAVMANPKLAGPYGGAWDDLARIQERRAQLTPRFTSVSSLAQSGLVRSALALVRAGDERLKPNGTRLPQYTDQALVVLQGRLSAPIPVYKDLEELELTLTLDVFRRDLGADDPFVHRVLGNESPQQLAHRLVTQTQLDDAKVRVALYNGGKAAVDASTDPMIAFAKIIDPEQRRLQKTYEAEVTAPSRAASERIAKARFAIYGTSVYPDATFTARVSYGTIRGFSDLTGQTFAPYTTIGGLFDRATGAPPYALPQTWLTAKPALDLTTPLNNVSTIDIIGGNSGSPLIDKNANIVGLIFDGNIFSLGGDYGYDPVRNRGVSVDSRGLLAGMKTVYHLDRIVDEIQAAAK